MRWEQAYEELRTFAAGDSEIRLTPHVTIIPEQIRPRFYQLFDIARTAFIREHLPDSSEETKQLKDLYFDVEGRVKGMLDLEEVAIPSEVSRFLNETEGRLSEALFDRLFELLRDQMDVETFEKQTSIALRGLYAELFQQAYRNWAVLSLIESLRGRAHFSVKAPLIEMTARGPKRVIDPQPIPKPEATRQLSFLSETFPAFVVPNFIVDSAEIGRFVAFKTEIGDVYGQIQVMWRAADANPEREWFSHEELESLWKRYHTLDLKRDVLFYVCDRLSDLALVADSERFARPDGVVVSVSRKDEAEKLHEKGRLYKDHLRPRSGVFMILPDPSREISVSPTEGIHWLPVGFDTSKLLPMVHSLKRHQTS
jgi:hypothetical protein